MYKTSLRYLFYRVVALLLLLISTSCSSYSHFQSTITSAQTFRVTADSYQLVITAVGPDSLEVNVESDLEPSLFPSFAKATKQRWPLTIDETEETVTIKRGQLTAVLNRSEGTIAYYRGDEYLTTQLPYVGEVTFDFSLQNDEQLMGGGQRVLGMDRRGYKLPLYNRADYGYTTESKQMNYSLPAVMSSEQYYLLFDNTASGELDLAATKRNTLSFRAVGGRIAYIIGTGNSYPSLIDEYTNVTGKPVMLPRWALGHFISRFGYHTQQEVSEVVALTQNKDIPADAVILDLYWFGPDIFNHMGNLDWNNNDFPDPEGMITELSEKNVNTILITEPFVLTSSNSWQDAVEAGAIATDTSGEPYRFDFYFGNTGLIDIFSDKGRDWFAEQYLAILMQGVAGHWGDLGEPEVHPDDIQHFLQATGEYVRGDVLHNVYGHEWAKLVYQTETSYKPNARPFILMRSGFAGTQRYGIVPWTGDVSRSWGGLKPQVELTLQMSLFGLGYTHSDIGGFAGVEEFEPEMYLRWSQYGIFQPIYRPHAQEQLASEIAFQDSDIIDIVRDFVKLRYQLTPYNYTLMYEHAQTGMPLMRPMLFENDDWLAIKDQYLWGDAFLVKPVTDTGVSSSAVQLPEGIWFDYWNGKVYEGNQIVDIPVTLNDIPVLIRGGAFIPMVPELNDLASYSTEQLILHYYHHESVTVSDGQLYDDDGHSADAFTSGSYDLLDFNAQSDANALNIALTKSGYGYDDSPTIRAMQLIIHGLTRAPNEVTANGKIIKETNYDKATKQLTLSFDWSDKNMEIRIIK